MISLGCLEDLIVTNDFAYIKDLWDLLKILVFKDFLKLLDSTQRSLRSSDISPGICL